MDLTISYDEDFHLKDAVSTRVSENADRLHELQYASAKLSEAETLPRLGPLSREMGGEPSNHKFLKDITGCTSRNPDERIFEG